MKNRKFLLIVSLVLAMTMSLGGTLAYLTDSDGDVNVMTVGRVEIKQNEQKRDGSAYEDQMLLPIVGSAGNKDEAGYPKAANYIDKIVTVTNTGNTAAWVRTLIAFPNVTYQPDHDSADASTEVIHWNGYSQGDEKIEKYKIAGIIPGKEGTVANNWVWGTEENGVVWPGNAETWNWVQNVMIDGKPYIVYIATNLKEVASQETTAPNLTGLYLDDGVDYDNDKGYYTYDNKPITYANSTDENPVYLTAGEVKVYVLSQAVQASGFGTAWAAFDAAFPLTEKDADGKVTKNEQEVVGEWFATMTKDTTGADNVPPVFEPVGNWLDYADTDWYDATKTEYTLSTAEELAGLSKLVAEGKGFSGKTVKLTADIDLGAHEWTPIGQTGGYYASTYFQGNFDGQNNSIKNLYITSTNEGGNYAAGLFGFLDCGQTGTIKNFTIDGATVKGHHWTGAAAGYLSGNMENVTVKNAKITCTHANDDACGDKAGAVVGYINGTHGTMTNCSAKDCTVTAGRDAGQVVGTAPATQVTNCTATNVTVSATGDCTGANIKQEIVGRNP